MIFNTNLILFLVIFNNNENQIWVVESLLKFLYRTDPKENNPVSNAKIILFNNKKLIGIIPNNFITSLVSFYASSYDKIKFKNSITLNNYSFIYSL